MPEAVKVPAWRFWVPLGLQLLMILAVPLPKLPAYAVGTPVVLRTVPVDPVDFLRGRYMRLGYEISSLAAVKKLPGWHDGMEGKLYFTLEPGTPAWKVVAVAKDPPPSKVVLAGKLAGSSVEFELEEYFIPENQGDRLANALRDHREGNLAEIKVDSHGTAVLTGYTVGNIRF